MLTQYLNMNTIILHSIAIALLILTLRLTTSMEERERCYSFVLYWTAHELIDLKLLS
jgi:hypothetical protein